MRPRSAMIVLLAGLLALAGCGRGAAPDTGEMAADTGAARTAMGIAGPMRVMFATPEDGDTVGPDVRIVLETENLELVEPGVMEPGSGHHHIFVDVDPTPPGEVIPAGVPEVIHHGEPTGEFTIEGLAPGPHRLIAEVGDGQHVALDPPVRDTVFITVVAEGAGQ